MGIGASGSDGTPGRARASLDQLRDRKTGGLEVLVDGDVARVRWPMSGWTKWRRVSGTKDVFERVE